MVKAGDIVRVKSDGGGYPPPQPHSALTMRLVPMEPGAADEKGRRQTARPQGERGR